MFSFHLIHKKQLRYGMFTLQQGKFVSYDVIRFSVLETRACVLEIFVLQINLQYQNLIILLSQFS